MDDDEGIFLFATSKRRIVEVDVPVKRHKKSLYKGISVMTADQLKLASTLYLHKPPHIVVMSSNNKKRSRRGQKSKRRNNKLHRNSQ